MAEKLKEKFEGSIKERPKCWRKNEKRSNKFKEKMYEKKPDFFVNLTKNCQKLKNGRQNRMEKT